mmetsp:Transcript_22364/g.34173  ORF Transcript_22364/g.34173 Transcript_22364/m.34173 type:complete len:437 (+) Transcript_22364:79-1389(+)
MVRFIAAVCVSTLICGASAFAPVRDAATQLKSAASAASPLFKAPSFLPGTSAPSTTERKALLTPADLPDKLYLKKEAPKVLGVLRAGTKEIVVITGASSGLGLSTAIALAKTNRYYVVMACRDVEKAKKVAKENGISESNHTVMKLELGSLKSVRDFVFSLKAFLSGKPLNHLICNAAVYRPTDPEPAWTDDGFEMSMGVNHLGHFLLVNLLLDDMSKAKNARCCIVGSITGNTNTVGGGLVYPRADLGNLSGLKEGMKKPISMADSKPFFGAKAYKDSKVCNMMTVSELHARYHDSTGITFSSMYPGCIAETALFREKRQWFRKAFPWFMKYVTGGYVSEVEAGERLAQVIDDPACTKSGVYWSWNGGAQSVGRWSPDGKPRGAGGSGGEIFENTQSTAVRDKETAEKMWEYSVQAVGLTEKDMYKKKKGLSLKP